MTLSFVVPSNSGYIDALSTVNRLMTTSNYHLPAPNARSSSYTTSISTYGRMQSALDTFQAAAQSLTGSAFNLYAATSSSASVASATTSPNSALGSHAVQVSQLATGQTLVSAGQASEAAPIGTGAATTLTFQFGTTVGTIFTANAGQTPRTVTIGTNNTLDGIAAAINAAGVGVTASVGFDGTTYHLIMTTNNSGAANSMTIGVTGDAALSWFASYAPGDPRTMIQSVPAQNAETVVNGVHVSTPTNVLVGTIPGTTLTLTGLGSTTVTVGPDAAQITSKAEDFVKAYNNLLTTLGALAQDDPASSTVIMTLRDQLSRTLTATQSALAGSTYTSLAQVGFTTQADGTLALKTATFESALHSSFGNIAKLFTNNGHGIADTLVSQIQNELGYGNWISSVMSGMRSGAAPATPLAIQSQTVANQYTGVNLALARWQQAGVLLSAQFPASGRPAQRLVNLFGLV